MPLYASKTSRPVTPIGSYPGRCCDVYDAGWWSKMNSETEFVQKVKLVFVIDTSEADDPEGLFVHDNGEPITIAYIDLFESLTLGDKANLRKHLASWRGKDLTAAELRGTRDKPGFDLESMLGKTAMVQVVHKEKADGSVRANIGTLTPLHRSIKAPDIPQSYVPDADREQPFATQHQKPKVASPRVVEQLQKARSAAAAEAVGDGGAGLEDDDSDLPF